jgi:hypothetical protein
VALAHAWGSKALSSGALLMLCAKLASVVWPACATTSKMHQRERRVCGHAVVALLAPEELGTGGREVVWSQNAAIGAFVTTGMRTAPSHYFRGK